MFVRFDGNFQPTVTISAFYITFLFMVIFNIFLNKCKITLKEILSMKYWIGKRDKIFYIYLKGSFRNCAELLLQCLTLSPYWLPSHDRRREKEEEENPRVHPDTAVDIFLNFLLHICRVYIPKGGIHLIRLVKSLDSDFLTPPAPLAVSGLWTQCPKKASPSLWDWVQAFAEEN